MKIRQKLFLGFGLYIILAAAFGYFTYRELHAITTRLKFLETADDVSITMLEVRRHEKNYLLYNEKQSLPELKRYLGVLKGYVAGIRPEITHTIGQDSYDQMNKTIASYEQWVDRIVENHRQQDALIEGVRVTGRDVEQRLSGRRLDTFLVLRRYEKNLFIYRDAQSYDVFMNTYSTLGANRDAEMDRYISLVKRLYGLYNDEKGYMESMRKEAREVQSFTVELSRKERAGIAATISTSMRLLLYSILTIIALGTAVNLQLSMSIAVPIRQLEKVTKKIAAGDFSESIEVSGKDEIASLGTSFNQMEERLKDALTSLEYTVNILQEKQAQLVEAEKLASIGLLSAGIAHEINNPLTSVLTFSHLMLEQMPEDDPNKERLRMMVWETDRARNIVRQLLSFARETPINAARIDINQPVNDVVNSLVGQDKFSEIELVVNLSHDMPEVVADPSQIGQVVTNLLLNAIHAITPPGRVEVSTRATERSVEIVVSDTGCGIPEESIGRIFEPFFTTWGAGKGTGLGLAVSYGIIKKHRGDVTVKSEQGKGTTFTVRLPING